VVRISAFIVAAIILLAVCPVFASDASIQLKYATFDPLAGEPTIPSDLRAIETPGQAGYYIVQFVCPVDDGMKDEVVSLGAELLDYVPDFAFIARMTPEIAAGVAGVNLVRWVGLYHPAYSISPQFMRVGGAANVKATVLMFPGESTAGIAAEVTKAAGTVRAFGSGDNPYVEITIPAQAISAIAKKHGVAWIEPRVERKLFNDVARGIMNVNSTWSGIGIYGSGEMVAVADTGLDTGSLTTMSADFAGRVFKYYKLGRSNKWDDPDAHGTHVCGSVLGSGVLSGSNPASHNYATSFAGAAPEAQLIIQSIITASGTLGGLPADLNNLYQPTYTDGARIHTNSWGAPIYGVYNTDSRNTDMFMWNHKDMIILFSAGNEGIDSNSDGVVDPDSIGAPGTAKNCITVGASENYRLSGGAQGTYGAFWPTDFPANPLNGDMVSNNSSGMVAFSSRGPTDDSRIKPDIVAPGTNIVSTRSHVSGSGTLWGVYNTHYLYSGGTSMSTPIVAGTCALVRQYWRTQRSHVPTAALIKATLLNGAAELNPGQYGSGSTREISTNRPNNVEGWGRVDLAYSIMPTSPRVIEYVDNTTGLSTGGSAIYTYNVWAATSPLRVMLVWTDYPSLTSASINLVNDLDLTVQPPSGPLLRGNGTTDRRNNVEGVDIASPTTGSYTITVTGYNIPNGPQPFALVVSGVVGNPPLPTAVIDLPANGGILAGMVSITGTASGTGFLDYKLEYGSGPSPSSWTQIGSTHTSPVTSGLLGTWDTASLANGTYTIRLTARNTTGSSTDTATVSVLKTSIASAKGNIDGTAITLTGKVVSATSTQFTGSMWVQEADRASGIRVNSASLPTTSLGDVVTITGTISTSGGERIITSPVVTWTGSSTAPKPLSIPNRSVGGGAASPADTGVANAGLLVTIWGDVTFVGSDYFYADDGFHLADGSGHLGIKVHTRTLTRPSFGQSAVVTGMCSAEVSGPVTRRVIRPRVQTDLVYR